MIVLTGHGLIASEFANQFRCEVISFRYLEKKEMDSIIEKADVIIHNSANINPVGLADAIDDNFILTKKIVDAIQRVNPTCIFIYISSMSLLRDENSYMDFYKMTPYAFSKYLGELYCLKTSLSVKIVRFSTIFYANHLRDGLSKLVKDAVDKREITLLNNGEALRDFIPLSICVTYLYKIIESFSTTTVFNVASGQVRSFKEIADIIKNNLPDLTVMNKLVDDSPALCHTFSLEQLAEIGIINFRLEEFVERYIKVC